MAARRPHQTVNEQDPTAGRPRTVFIACAALAREVRTIIKKYGWNADFEAVDAALHFYPKKIGPAVEQRLEKTVGHYERRVVVYGGLHDAGRVDGRGCDGGGGPPLAAGRRPP